MSIDRYSAHRAALATDEARKRELTYVRVFCHFFGGVALMDAFLNSAFAPLALVVPSVLLEIATRRRGRTRHLIFGCAVCTAIGGEAAQLILLFSVHHGHALWLIEGAFIIWATLWAWKLSRSLGSSA